MSKNHYLPQADKDRIVWFNNFVSKFAPSAVGLGFVAADVTAVNNDAAMFQYLVNQVETYTSAKEQRVNFRDLIKNGPIGKLGGSLPVAPVAPTLPAMVAPGILPRLSQLVRRIKVSPTYTEAIGRDLGIIGAEQTLTLDSMKPVLKLVFKGGLVEVQWTKGDADAVHIEADKGDGWKFLAVDTVPHYPDTTVITAPGLWKYRAIYLVGDERVGQWSDVASISVGK
jgi:hypothetical protein